MLPRDAVARDECVLCILAGGIKKPVPKPSAPSVSAPVDAGSTPLKATYKGSKQSATKTPREANDSIKSVSQASSDFPASEV